MRLLTKSELAKAKADEQAREVAQGLKIGSRVDALRELKVSEEEALNKWRNETILLISREIADYSERRDSILLEVIELRKEKEKGLQEVYDERANLDELEDAIQERQEEVGRKEAEIASKREELENIVKASHGELERARSHREEAERLHASTLEDREHAKIELKEAEEIKENFLVSKRETEVALEALSERLARQEESIKKREEESAEKEKELRIKELRLIDREKTLERNVQRRKR